MLETPEEPTTPASPARPRTRAGSAAPTAASGARAGKAASATKAGAATKATGLKGGSKPRKRTPPDPNRAWSKRLARVRPSLIEDVLAGLREAHGNPAWERRLDPTSELILTILTQNSADVNAEKAFESLRLAFPSDRPAERHLPGQGWGGLGLSEAPPPDWAQVEDAPLPVLVEAIRPGGLAQVKAPRIQATLRFIREERGDHSLEFLAEMAPLDARDWLTRINGVGKKTASVLLSFCFDMPLMAVDRHVERVSHRIGLIPPKASADEAHDLYLAMLRPDQTFEAHVNLIRHGRDICHARRPECDRCPVRPRCRFVDPKAP